MTTSCAHVVRSLLSDEHCSPFQLSFSGDSYKLSFIFVGRGRWMCTTGVSDSSWPRAEAHRARPISPDRLGHWPRATWKVNSSLLRAVKHNNGRFSGFGHFNEKIMGFSALSESWDQNHSGVFIFVTFRVLLFKIYAIKEVNTFSFALFVWQKIGPTLRMSS